MDAQDQKPVEERSTLGKPEEFFLAVLSLIVANYVYFVLYFM